MRATRSSSGRRCQADVAAQSWASVARDIRDGDHRSVVLSFVQAISDGHGIWANVEPAVVDTAIAALTERGAASALEVIDGSADIVLTDARRHPTVRAALVDCLVEGLAAGDPAAAPLLARIQDDG